MDVNFLTIGDQERREKMAIFLELETLGLNCWRNDWDWDYNRCFHENVCSLFNSVLTVQ